MTAFSSDRSFTLLAPARVTEHALIAWAIAALVLVVAALLMTR